MPNVRRSLTRRRFLADSATIAAGAAVVSKLTPLAQAANPVPAPAFATNWKNSPDRVWLGQEFWSNPLQDWRLAEGRAECTNAAADRNVHLLVRSIGEH